METNKNLKAKTAALVAIVAATSPAQNAATARLHRILRFGSPARPDSEEEKALELAAIVPAREPPAGLHEWLMGQLDDVDPPNGEATTADECTDVASDANDPFKFSETLVSKASTKTSDAGIRERDGENGGSDTF